MDIKKHIEENVNIIKLHKIGFIYNALEKGWSVSKIDNKYIFRKKHKDQKEIFLDDYLKQFVTDNCNIDILS